MGEIPINATVEWDDGTKLVLYLYLCDDCGDYFAASGEIAEDMTLYCPRCGTTTTGLMIEYT